LLFKQFDRQRSVSLQEGGVRGGDNGLAEALVRTFKRDYVPINPLPDAVTVLRQLHWWFADYVDNHLHSGLGMRSPREFIRAYSPIAGVRPCGRTGRELGN
jgi:transposase InsO family protein